MFILKYTIWRFWYLLTLNNHLIKFLKVRRNALDKSLDLKEDSDCNNNNVDIAFLVDCTTSMAKHVRDTKRNIGDIVKGIRGTFKNNVRLAFVAYRDITCPNNIQEMDFSNKIKDFTTFADKNC